MQFLYAVLDVAALAIDMLVNPLRTPFHVGDEETRVVFGFFVGGADNFGFDDDAAAPWPLAGLVVGFSVNMFGLSTAQRQLARSPHSWFGDPLQQRILGHRDDIFELGLGVQKLEYGRIREPAIQAHANLHSWNMSTNHLHQALQNRHPPLSGGYVGRAVVCDAEILFGFVVEADKTHYWQVAPRVIVMVEERQLLRAVRGIVGRGQVGGDAIRAMT